MNFKRDYNNSNKGKKAILVIIIYRLGNKIMYAHINGITKIILLIPLKILKFIIFSFFGIECSFSPNIGEGLGLLHLNGIVIHGNANIGQDCTILQQVTIGESGKKKDSGKVPKIGDRVFIGTGAKLLGNIIIGNDVRIGANAVVTKNIPDSCTVVGYNKIIKNEINEDMI